MRDPTSSSTPQITPDQVATMRRNARLSQTELGFTIRRSQPFISDYERGLRTLSAREEKTIARVLGIGRAE